MAQTVKTAKSPKAKLRPKPEMLAFPCTKQLFRAHPTPSTGLYSPAFAALRRGSPSLLLSLGPCG